MSIQDMEIAKELSLYGSQMKREGLSQRALEIAKNIIKDGSYKGAIIGMGRMIALGQACNFDEYWKEKRNMGKQAEREYLELNYQDYPKYPRDSD